MIWIGIDAHKRVHQAVALSMDGVLAQKVIANTAVGWTELLRWASTWPERIWAVEGSGSLGRGVAQFLAVGGEQVHEVNPRWTAHRRRGLRRLGKSDVLDAQVVARLLREEGESLPLIQAETVASASLQLWSRLRDDLVLDMTRLRNRLHALLLLCDPEYKHVIRSLRSRIGIQAACAYTAPGTSQLDRVREQAVRLVAKQIALLMDQERELRTNIESSVRQHFAPLLRIEGRAGDPGGGSDRGTRHAAARFRRAADRCTRWRGTRRGIQCRRSEAPSESWREPPSEHAAVPHRPRPGTRPMGGLRRTWLVDCKKVVHHVRLGAR